MRMILLAFVVLLATASIRAEDAPQFRGAGGGVSGETGLPTKWSETENLRWKAELPGRGLSNAVVAAGRVYVTACSGPEQKREHVLCFDARTGKKLWERQLWATGSTVCHPKTNMAAPTPVTDGTHVYALFATGDLVCYGKDGDLAWYRSLVSDYPTVGNNVGIAVSPVLSKDTLIICLENAGESFAAGIDIRTGRNRWRVERPRGINWVTPLVIDNAGRAEVVMQGPADLTAYDPLKGAKLWSLTGHTLSTIPSPVWGDGMIFTPGDKFLAVRPGKEGQKPAVAWQSTKLRTGYCSPVYYDGRVYVLATEGIVNCADARTGKALWSHRLDTASNEPYAASPLLAEGRLYVVSEKGTTTVLKVGAEPTVLGANALPDTILASPVAADGALFLRSDRYLYCIGGKK